MKNMKILIILSFFITSIINCQNFQSVNQNLKYLSYSSLIKAVYDNDYIKVQRLLEQGADVNENKNTNNYTPLMWAASMGNYEVAGLLINKGANINETNNYRTYSPLMLAASNGHLDIVRLFLDKGADINLSCNEYNPWETALYAAITSSDLKSRNNTSIIQLLVKRGAIIYRKQIEASIYNKAVDSETLLMLKKYYTGNTITTKYNEGLLLAVIDFEPRGLPRQESVRLSEWIRAELINTDQFKVIDRVAMDGILKEQSFSLTGCTDTSCAVKVGKLLSARKILVGTIESYNNQIFISGRIVDVEKGVAEFAHIETVNSLKELEKGSSNFVKTLTERINGIQVQ
jgi:hypothetical protein